MSADTTQHPLPSALSKHCPQCRKSVPMDDQACAYCGFPRKNLRGITKSLARTLYNFTVGIGIPWFHIEVFNDQCMYPGCRLTPDYVIPRWGPFDIEHGKMGLAYCCEQHKVEVLGGKSFGIFTTPRGKPFPVVKGEAHIPLDWWRDGLD